MLTFSIFASCVTTPPTAVGWGEDKMLREGGLLHRSTARYFYKGSKTILHKPTANSGINIVNKKCVYK
jgi:hypothetical protein